MKVILVEDVKGSGKKGQVVNVSDGYAKNFLLPKKLAIVADQAAMQMLEDKKKSQEHREQLEREAAQAIADRISGKTVKISAKAGAGGKLFGSVTAKEIASALSSQYGAEVDRRKISLADDIKAFGSYEAEVKLHSGISTKIFVSVCEES